MKSEKNGLTLALVTGASSGIGKALSRKLASEGIALILTARNLARLEALAEELRTQVHVDVIAADLVNREERKKIVAAIQELSPDLLVNNAGYGFYGNAIDYQTKEMLDMLEVDGGALLEFSLEAARVWVAQKKSGVIMNISSSAAFQIFPLFAVYSAAKAFVNQFSESFDQEMRPYGIRVLAACPGVVTTGFRSRAAGGTRGEGGEERWAMTVEFAADEIWKQIQRRQTLHVFDWKYRLGVFFSKYVLPKWLVARVLKGEIGRLKG